MNTFEKVLRFCIKNKIRADLSYFDGNIGKVIQIWQSSNSYYQIHKFNDTKYNKNHTVISDNAFGLDTLKNDGNYYHRISYNDLINELKSNLKLYQSK